MAKILQNATATRQFGRSLARKLRGGDVVSLEGTLCAGKTTLLQGLARGLSIKKNLTSPTFILFRTVRLPKEQRTIKWLMHADAYRIAKPQEFVAAGFLDFLGEPSTLTVIEWGDKIKKLLPRGTQRVILKQSGRVRSVIIKRS